MLDDSPTRVLVTGGCGYIGSHAVAEVLRHTRAEVVVVDDLSNSPREVVDALAEAGGRGLRFHGVDICDGAGLRRALRGYDGFDAVLHFAARKSVPESLADPLGYYANNVGGMIELLDYARGAGVRAFVFSSSCIVYGDAAALPVCETAPPGAPRSPYGHTKQLGEQLLRLAPGMRRIGLRYFNPAGADNSGLLGDRGEGTYAGLAKVLCRAAQTGAPVRVFGADYPTPDGTCVRDYVHVSDIAEAHVAALAWALEPGAAPALEFVNLGSERGYSVREAIAAFEHATGERLAVEDAPRRPGDLAASYGDCAKARRLLGWRARRSLPEIMESAWAWTRMSRAVPAAPTAR